MTTVLHGDALAMLRTLPDSSVNVVVTSPPYWALRSYCKDEDEKAHELGREKVPDCLGWATGNRCGECHICRMVAVFHEVRRVLRGDGVCWVDYGDCYSAHAGQRKTEDQRGPKQCTNRGSCDLGSRNVRGLQAGDMVGIPWRFALAMQADGWCLRQDLVWAKPAPMPESINGWRWERCRVKISRGEYANETHPGSYKGEATQGGKANRHCVGGEWQGAAGWRDCPGCPKCSATGGYVLRQGAWRCTKAHEYVFMFTKDMDYFCDAEAAKESTAGSNTHSKGTKREPPKENAGHKAGNGHEGFCALTAEMLPSRNPRDVLNIGPDPFRGAHFACFPRELPRRLIRWSTSERGYCPKCGAPWCRVIEKPAGTPDPCRSWDTGDGTHGRERRREGPIEYAGKNESTDKQSAQRRVLLLISEKRARLRSQLGRDLTHDEHENPHLFLAGTVTIGWRPSCSCGETATVPAVVLDPFGGSGTVGEVCEELHVNSILIELNSDYLPLITERCRQPSLLAHRNEPCQTSK